MVPLQTLTAGTAACSVHDYVVQCPAAHGRHAAGLGCVTPAGPKAVAAAATGWHLAPQGIAAACLPSTQRQRRWRVVAAASTATAVVAEPSLEQQPNQQQCPDPVDTYSLLHQLHQLCDDSVGLAEPAQLHAWSISAQPRLASMSLAELAYVASCLRHHHYMWQQQDQQRQIPSRGFVASPGFLQEACSGACAAATAAQQELQQMYSLQQDAGANEQTAQQPRATVPHHQQLVACLHQISDLLQWASAEVVQHRQLLQQQLLQMQQGQQAQQQQEGPGLDPASPAVLQAYRQQLQQQVEAQQQVHRLLQHPLLLQALPHANCWQLQQLLVCYGHLGQSPRFDWMGQWLAAARHAMSDLVLAYQQQDWHLQHQHGPNWQQHVYEHQAAAAAAYVQLVGLLSGLAAAHTKPQDAWISTWQQAAKAVLAAQPCFTALEQHDSSIGSNSSDSSSSLLSMLQQLLQSVSSMGLRLSADFWAAHEGFIQAQVLSFSPSELLRLLQLHQQVHLRPSRACIKYMTAVLEQHLAQQAAALRQQQQQECGSSSVAAGAGSSSLTVLQLVMCVCGLSMWEVRLHLRSVAELIVLLEAHKGQLPLSVTLQVMSILGTRMARVYSLGTAPSSSGSEASSANSSGSSGSYCSGSSMCTLSTDDDAATPGLAAACESLSLTTAAAAVEELLLHAAEQLAPYAAAVAPPADDRARAQRPSSAVAGSSSSSSSDAGPLLKLLQISATLARNCARASSSSSSNPPGSAYSLTDSVTTLAAAVAAVDSSSGTCSTAGVAFIDRLVHKLHPLCAAVAPVCSPQQLLAVMTAWNQIGFSGAWRFGGFRRGHKRLSQQGVLQSLSSGELACAVEAVSKLPPAQAVVQALAAEVMRRQARQDQTQRAQVAQGSELGMQQAAAAGGLNEAAAAATDVPPQAQPLAPSQLLTVISAIPNLNPLWPADITLQLLQQVEGAVDDTLNPSQQWRLWNALQQLQEQWKPSVVAAAAAAAAVDCGASSLAAHSAGDKAAPSMDMHPAVTFAVAAAAAAAKAGPAPVAAATAVSGGGGSSSVTGHLMRPSLPSAPATDSNDVQVSTSQAAEKTQQQQLMQLLDQLQGKVAAALARVQPDPDALPLEAAAPKLTAPMLAQQRQQQLAAAPTAAAKARLLQQEGKRTEQQVLAAFAKAQKSLLNPHCSGAAMVKVLEGLLLLLAVPRYAKAARKNETVRRAVLRALEASAWPDLLAQSLDIQQLLLLTAAARLLGSGSEGPYMQLLGQETSRVLAEVPLKYLASGLGRIANLRLPEFKTDITLLKFWVGRLAQAARHTPEEALAVVVPLTQLGFRPGAGAAGLVLQPLLAAASDTDAAMAAAANALSTAYSSDSGSSSAALTISMSSASVLSLTKMLSAASLRPDDAGAKQLLKAHISIMRHFSVAQQLQLCRDVLNLQLLTTASAPTAASSKRTGSASDATGSLRAWLLPGAGAWLAAWLKQLVERDGAQMGVAQVVELHLLLCELDFVPWHLSPSHSAHVNTRMQQLQANLAAVPGWHAPLSAAVQASYHSTQELRRLVAARARRLAHEQSVSSSNSSGTNGLAGAARTAASGSVHDAVAAAMQLGDSAPDSTAAPCARSSSSSSDTYTGEAYSGTRKFVSRRSAAAAAAAVGAAGGQGAGPGGFSYPGNPVNQQLQQLNHQKRVLLWAAIKHEVVKPLTAAWVESCCFNVLVGGHHVTPAVVTGLLGAVAQARSSSNSSRAGVSASAEVAMREQALMNLTAELVGRVLSATQVLKGALFVQAVAALSAAGVTVRSRSDSRPANPKDAAAPTTATVSGAAAQPFFELSHQQQLQLLSDVARVLPLLQPSQLPLLVNSMMRLQLSPGAAWLSDILHALAVKAAAAAAAGQPAQQLLLLAAAKQLLVCGGVMLAPSTASAVPASSAAADGGHAQSKQTVQASFGGRSPVAFAFRSLAAGAAQVLGSVFRRAHDQHNKSSSSGLAGKQPRGALAAAAAAMSDVPPESESSVSLLLSSLATQLQLAQAASSTAPSADKQPHEADATARAAAMLQALQARRAVQAGRAGSPGPDDAQKQQRQLLAAAVLLHAGSGVPATLSAGDGSRPLRVMTSAAGAEAPWDGAWHGLNGAEKRRQEAQQQQQQRVLLGQLLRLQLQKASEQLVEAVWGQQGQQEAQHSAADVYASQVLLDPTGGLLSSNQQLQPDSAEGLEQQQQQQRVRPHHLVTQGLQVQFDGLLRKAFMAAAAAAAAGAGRQWSAQGGGEAGTGVQAVPARREPWWLRKAPRDVSGLLQASADDFVSSSPGSNSAGGTDGLMSEAVPVLVAGGSGASPGGDCAVEGGCQAGVSADLDGREPVVVLPVMSRALDAQFARLMREVLHSSLATGGSSRSNA